jgi:hypothetical protein
MAESLAVVIYVPGPDGSINEPQDCYGDLTPEQASTYWPSTSDQTHPTNHSKKGPARWR